MGLQLRDETLQDARVIEGLEMDIVSHDVRKSFTLLLRKNGYVLEKVFSPLTVLATTEHEDLQAPATGCITRHHAQHYSGFVATQWKLFEKERPRRLKPLLYVYRVPFTGIHLMRAGRIVVTEERLGWVDLAARRERSHRHATSAR